MDAWFEAIVEWVNCLDILDTPIKNVDELRDGEFFAKLIELLSWKNQKEQVIGQDRVNTFIQDEYPEFSAESGTDDGSLEQVHVASLLLLHASQEPRLHRPMCIKLRHETQIKIKTFLEKLLHHGKSLTRELINCAIMELVEMFESAQQNTFMTPPMVPKARPLRDFFDSPVTHSASKSHRLIDERNRELRRLRSELETERYEKADLLQDLSSQQNKIESLQMKLQEKITEIKQIRDARTRPVSPQSCKKMKDKARVREDRQRREIQSLEDYSAQLRSEIDKLQDEKDKLIRKLASVERQCAMFKEKSEDFERSLETFAIQNELKDRELEEHRMQLRELRAHMQEIRKESIGEQSFEMENSLMFQSPLRSLNNSEVLSSVIDVQLQEAKEESNVLKAQLHGLNERLESVYRDYHSVTQHNVALQEKANLFESVQQELSRYQMELNDSHRRISTLEDEKLHLLEVSESLRNSLSSKEELIKVSEMTNESLKFNLEESKNKLESVEDLLSAECSRAKDLESKIKENLETIGKIKTENLLHETTIENCHIIFRDLITDLSRITGNCNIETYSSITELSEQLGTLINSFESIQNAKESDIMNLNSTVSAMDSTVSKLRTDIFNLEERDKKNALEQSRMTEAMREADLRIHSLESKILQYVEEIGKLKIIAKEKEVLAKDLAELRKDLSHKNTTIESFIKENMTFRRQLLETKHSLSLLKDEKTTLAESIRIHNETFVEGIECISGVMVELQGKADVANSVILELNERLKSIEFERNELLETLRIEESVSLQKEERLKSSLDELTIAKRELDSTVNKLSVVAEQLANEQEARCALQGENVRLVETHQDSEARLKCSIESLEKSLLETQKSWDTLTSEMQVKHEALEMMKNKVEQVTNAKIESEMKLKEVILNLQEVRSGQEALLKTQTNALDDFQRQLDQLKISSTAERDNEKQLRLELQAKYETLEKEHYHMINVNEDTKIQLQAALEMKTKDLNSIILELNERLKSIEFERNELLESLRIEESVSLQKEERLKLSLNELSIAKRELDLTVNNLSVVAKQLADEQEARYALQGENVRLVETHQESEARLKCSIESLEKSLLETQKSLETLSGETQMKHEALEMMKNKVEQVTNTKLESEMKLKEDILSLQKIRSDQEALLATQTNALQDCQRQLDQLKISSTAERDNEKQLRLELQAKYETLEKEHYHMINVNEDTKIQLQDALEMKTKDLNSIILELNERLKSIEFERNELLETLRIEKSVSLQKEERLNELTIAKGELDSTVNKLSVVAKQLADEQEARYALQGENMRLVETHQESEARLKCSIESLEKSLLETQKSLDTLSGETQMKHEALEMMKNKVEQVTNAKLESEMKLKEDILSLQKIMSDQEALLATQTDALQDCQRQLDQLKMSSTAERDNEKQLRLELQAKYETLEKEYDHMINVNKDTKIQLQAALDIETKELNAAKKSCDILKSEMLEMIAFCEHLKSSMNGLQRAVEESHPCLAILHDDPIQDVGQDKKLYHGAIGVNDVKDFNCKELLMDLLRFLENGIAETKRCVLHLSNANKNLEREIRDEKVTSENLLDLKEQNSELRTKVEDLEIVQKRYEDRCQAVISFNEILQERLVKAMSSRSELGAQLSELNETFTQALHKYQTISTSTGGDSMCDELKQLQAMRKTLEGRVADLNKRHYHGLQMLPDVVCGAFAWTHKELQELTNRAASNLNGTEIKVEANDLADEKPVIYMEIEKDDDALRNDIVSALDEIEVFSKSVGSYEIGLNMGQMKREERLQKQLDQLAKEKKDVKDKLDMIRVRNARLEKSLDDLRKEVKRLEAEKPSAEETARIEELESRFAELREENELLKTERDELGKRPTEQDFENRLKEVHNEYGLKLEKIKQKMKTAYNEQMAKLINDQEKALQEKMESLRMKMEQQCRKHTEEIAKYKEHVSDLSSQFWEVGEKLLVEKQAKEAAVHQLQEFKRRVQNDRTHNAESSQQYRQQQEQQQQQQIVHAAKNKTSSLDRRDFATDTRQFAPGSVGVIEEVVTTSSRRQSVNHIQAMGNAFKVEDEEGEVFDNTYLTDMKEGRQCLPVPDMDRLSVLQMRNSLCKPHLKSSYPAETQFHSTVFTEEDIKSGGTNEDVFNDSLSQSLLPGEKPKKRDRTQTSYKRPGPPTPSKNGGRASLQGNETRSPNSRILKEQNTERRTTATPRRLMGFLGNTLSRRQDENVPGTPKGRRLSSIFRKPK